MPTKPKTYTYKLDDDFDDEFNFTQFRDEVAGSAVIGTVLLDIVLKGNSVKVRFTTSLTSLQEDALDALVAAHLPQTANPFGMSKADVGLSNVKNTLNAADATLVPDANDDEDQGYSVGSHWYNVAGGDAYVCLDASDGAAVWKQITPAAAASPATVAARFDMYTTTETPIILTGVWTDMPLDVARITPTAHFSHAGGASPEVTVAEDVTCQVTYRVCLLTTLLSARTESENRLMIDTGSGYAAVPGTLSRNYHREVHEGETTATVVAVLELAAGDKLKVQSMRSSGVGLLQFYSEACSLTILQA
jgi:hypothetical protein